MTRLACMTLEISLGYSPRIIILYETCPLVIVNMELIMSIIGKTTYLRISARMR